MGDDGLMAPMKIPKKIRGNGQENQKLQNSGDTLTNHSECRKRVEKKKITGTVESCNFSVHDYNIF